MSSRSLIDEAVANKLADQPVWEYGKAGDPVFPGTQVLIEDFLDWIMHGKPLSGFLAEHPELDPNAVGAYLRYDVPRPYRYPSERR